MWSAVPTLVRVASRPIEALDLYHVLPGSRALVVGFAEPAAANGRRAASIDPAWPLAALPRLARTGRCATVAFAEGEPLFALPALLAAAELARSEGFVTALRTRELPSAEACVALAPRLDAVALELAPLSGRPCGAVRSHDVRDRLARLRQAGVWVEVVTPLSAEVAARDLLETALSLKAIDGAIPWHVRAQRKLLLERPELAAAEVAQAVAAGERAGLEHVYAPEAPSGDREITYCSVCRDVVLIERFVGQPQSYLADGRRCPRCGTRAKGLFERAVASASA